MSTIKLPAYGGQALIEGVMMRGTRHVVAAMRAPDHHIEIYQQELTGVYSSPFRKIPFLRGLFILWDSMGLGINLLTISANIQSPQEDEKIEGPAFYASIALAFAVAILIFFVSPALIGQWLQKLFSTGTLLSNVIEGLLRLAFLVIYLVLIGKMKDIERVFAYHGAEHKTINAYEAGATLFPEVVKEYSIMHPRCGTSFILTIVLFSIILFSLLGPLTFAERIISRVLLIPILASISYEYIRWAANHIEKLPVKILMSPNLLLQKLTTREPDTDMLETSITALDRLLELEGQKSVGATQ
jgi:uncharacterized protein YqhQ